MTTIIDAFKAILNTVVRLSPIGLYVGSAMSGTVFNDFRGILLLLGFVLNEMLSLGYRIVLKGVENKQCAFLMSIDGSPFVLPSPITQTIGFFYGFLMSEMYNNDQFNPFRFFYATTIMLLTIYSRINVGCKSIIDALYCAILGALIGVIYFALIKDYYRADFLLFKTDKNKNMVDNITNLFSQEKLNNKN